MEETTSELEADSSVYADREKPAYIETINGETTVNGVRIKDCIITADYRPNPDDHKDPYLSASIQYPQISGMPDIRLFLL